MPRSRAQVRQLDNRAGKVADSHCRRPRHVFATLGTEWNWQRQAQQQQRRGGRRQNREANVPAAADQLAASLASFKMSELRQQATAAGASHADIEAAGDVQNPRSALVELIRSHSKRSTGGPKSVPPPPPPRRERPLPCCLLMLVVGCASSFCFL